MAECCWCFCRDSLLLFDDEGEEDAAADDDDKAKGLEDEILIFEKFPQPEKSFGCLRLKAALTER